MTREESMNIFYEKGNFFYPIAYLFILCSCLFLASFIYAENADLRQLKIYESTLSKTSFEKWQIEVRKKLANILLFPEQKPTDFEVRQIKEDVCERFKLEEYEIQSTFQRRIRVCLAVPLTVESKKFPAVVCIHGHSGNRYTPFEKESSPYHEFGKKLVQNGYVVISTDIGQHEIYETGRTLMGERLWDLMRCVDYLESLPFVDTHRIACAGLSLGGEMAMWLGAMDTRIKATVVCGFLTYMDQMEKNHCLCWKFPGLREAVDFPDIYGLIAPRALQCQNGEKEPPDQFPPSLAQKAWLEIKVVYEKFVAVDKMELVIHPGGHEIAIEPMLNFLNKQLK